MIRRGIAYQPELDFMGSARIRGFIWCMNVQIHMIQKLKQAMKVKKNPIL